MTDVDAGAAGVVHADVVKDVYRLLDVFHQAFVPQHVGVSHGVSVRYLVAVLHWNIFLNKKIFIKCEVGEMANPKPEDQAFLINQTSVCI